MHLGVTGTIERRGEGGQGREAGGGGKKAVGKKRGGERRQFVSLPPSFPPACKKETAGQPPPLSGTLQFILANILSYRFAQLKCYVPTINN
jgi:hypothetical protein